MLFDIIKSLLHECLGNIKIYYPRKIKFASGKAFSQRFFFGKLIFKFPSPSCNKCKMYRAIGKHWQGESNLYYILKISYKKFCIYTFCIYLYVNAFIKLFYYVNVQKYLLADHMYKIIRNLD